LQIMLDHENWVLKTLYDSLPRLRSVMLGNRQLTPVWNRFTPDSVARYNVYRSLSLIDPMDRINQDPVADTSYLDTGLVNGTRYYYAVTALAAGDTCYETRQSNRVSRIPTGVAGGPGSAMPATAVALANSRPNPFMRTTVIAFQLPVTGTVSLKVYNVAGQLVRTLVDAGLPAGRHSAAWDGQDDRHRPVAPGVYLYRLEAGDKTLTRSLRLVR
jgi:hypothetical protein